MVHITEESSGQTWSSASKDTPDPGFFPFRSSAFCGVDFIPGVLRVAPQQLQFLIWWLQNHSSWSDFTPSCLSSCRRERVLLQLLQVLGISLFCSCQWADRISCLSSAIQDPPLELGMWSFPPVPTWNQSRREWKRGKLLRLKVPLKGEDGGCK